MLAKERFVVVSVVVLVIITGMTLSHAYQWIWVQAAWDDPFLLDVRELAVSKVLGYVTAGAAGIFVLKHEPTYVLATEVVEELSKVTWPSREETGNATVVVIITVVICSAFLGAFDAIWLALTDWILGIDATG